MSIQRIVIIGPPGSGKTTLSTLLSQQLDIPVFHLDRYLWLPGGIKRKRSEFVKIQEEIMRKEKSWIIEGCGTNSLEIRYSKADWVVYMNLSRWTCIWRSFKRFLFEKNLHPDTPEGCSKVFNWELIRYTWNFYKNKAPGIYNLKEKYPEVRFDEVSHSKDIKTLLEMGC